MTSGEALLSVSVLQALTLWEELSSALYGDNRYAGDVAEVYVFRLMPHSPTAVRPMSDTGLDAYRTGCRCLHALCRLFETRNEAVVTFEDGSSIDALLDDEPETHRVHLKVVRAS